MSGVKAQTTREAVHAPSTSSVGPRFDSRQDLESERAKVRDILATGQTLAPATRHSMESAFGAGFGDVRVHTSPEAGAAARALGARAFAVGTDIVFGAGNYLPGVPAGERLIAHELAHVVQQRSAGVSGLAAFPESVSTPTHPAEVEAERAASLAVRGLPVPRLTPSAGAVMRDVSMNLDAGPEADVVPVRPTARTNRQMVAEGREAVSNALDPTQRHLVADLTHLIVSGQDILWLDANGKRKGTFAMRPDAVIWATGYYLAMESALVRLVEQKNERWWAPWSFEKDETAFLTHWLQPAEAKRFQAEVASVGSLVALVGIPETKPADDSSAGDVATAERLVSKVRERIARSVATKEGDEETSSPGGEGKGVPDRLVVWSDERGPFLNVWADGVCKALPLSDGETEEALQSRVEEATEELRESRDAANSTQVAKGAKQTGFTGKDGQFVGGALPADVPRLAGARNVANTLPYPSKIVNYGQEITVTGSSSRFEMTLDYASAGSTTLDQVGARMQPITYFWDIFDVTDMQPESRGDMRNAALSSDNQLSRTDSIARDFGRKMGDIAEDTAADVDDATSGSALSVVATWPARSAWLGVVGLSNVVRFGKASISSYIDLVTTPRSEQGVGWDREGEFLVRCVASPQFDDDSPVRRASSVAAVVVKVMDVNRRATQVNDQNLKKLRRLEALRDEATGEERDGLDAQIVALRRVETASVAELGGDARTAIEERIAVANQLAADRKGSVARDSRTPASRLLDAQLELQGIPLEEYQQQLAQQKEQVGQRLQLIGKVGARIPGANFRPAVTLVSEENGQAHELVMMLGEAEGSREGARHYLLADVTAPSPKDRYVFEGRSGQAGTKGHAEAVRKAFVDFRENNGYGRGTLALRLPKALEDAAGGPLGLEPRMRSAPGTRGRVMQRLTDLATVAEIAGLFLTGPAGLAVGLAGGVAGAIVAVDSLSRRHSAGALKWDFQTLMDVSAIVGGVAGVAAPALSALRNAPRWAKRVERLQGLLHIYGVTQLGATVIIIPYQLEMELAELEKLQGQLSPGQLAARRAEAILGAVRSGLMTAGSAVQMLHPPDAGGSPHPADSEDGLSTRPAEGEPRVSTPDEVMEPVSREARAPGDEGPLPVDAAGPTTRQPAKSERVTALELELGDLQGKVAVVEVGPPELKGRSTRVRYRKGRVQIEVGPEAGPHQIRTHVETARLLRRYEGPIGHIRRLLSRLVQALTRIPGYGTLGFESRLEVRKLNGIISELESLHAGIDERIQRVGDKEGSALAREKESVQRDIAELEIQLEHYERLVDSLEAGRGYVAAEYQAATETTLSTVKADLGTLRTVLEIDGKLSITTRIIDQAALLQHQGRMTGVEAWVQDAAKRGTTPRLLEHRLSELSGAVLQASSSPADLVALVPPASGGTAPFTTAVTSGGGKARRQIGDREKAARLWFSGDKVAAFDLWADLQVSSGRDLEKALDTSGGKGLKEPFVRAVVDSTANTVVAKLDQAHRHVANLVGDPLRPNLPHERTEMGVRIISGTAKARMEKHEVQQASELQTHSKEAVVLFASDAAGNSFPGIDGTIASPPRPIQLKYLKPTFEDSASRGTAMGALERARNAGINHVEVYIKADGKSMEAVQAGWGGPLKSDTKDPRLVGDVFENQIIKLIEIHCSDGVMQVEFVNGTYVFKEQ
ncbi:DUF4157 domain-containing protein [Corallococcus exiguus]|uniref:eCIS core domain-containing protein n=1 Tax=Corallococcus exiguus TaxID=83462 RepID=UPI00147567DD|nr:DUF4157 domain-containing protein [Corallococcus exiguus]NNB92911.1 DUF4157 domain-containing protein [Corallococcus exiguus]